jgi:RNA polymerase sigma-70 factor (ECF subfamily)
MTEREYNECVQQFADNVYRFILKNLRHQEDARDVVQSAFEKLWVNRDVVQIEKSKSYLFTIAYNQMSKLNETQRSLVMLKDYEGYNYAEIGEITGLNESQVKVYLHRARLQLKAYLVNIENVL